MSSKMIRDAARQIREEWQDDADTGDYVCETLLFVADWLDSEADRCDQLTRALPATNENGEWEMAVGKWGLANALRIASAYTGDDPA